MRLIILNVIYFMAFQMWSSRWRSQGSVTCYRPVPGMHTAVHGSVSLFF